MIIFVARKDPVFEFHVPYHLGQCFRPSDTAFKSNIQACARSKWGFRSVKFVLMAFSSPRFVVLLRGN
jgi:hypothetical protein